MRASHLLCRLWLPAGEPLLRSRHIDFHPSRLLLQSQPPLGVSRPPPGPQPLKSDFGCLSRTCRFSIYSLYELWTFGLRRLSGVFGRSWGSPGRLLGRGLQNQILDACPELVDSLYTPSVNFGLSGSGGCPWSLGAPGGLLAASDVFAAVSDFGGIASEAFS